MTAQQVVIITGMHRSGTSLIASLLRAAGVNIGDDLLGPNRGNLRGHFEDIDFYRFHEKILQRFGQTLLVQTPSAVGELTPAETEEALGLIARRGDRSLWGWKEPRTALFLDFWRNLLPQARYIFVYRHPLEVSLSLLRRSSDLEAMTDPLLGLGAWQVYNRAILHFYQQHSEVCMLVHISRFTANIQTAIDLTAQKLALPLHSTGIPALYAPAELKQLSLSTEARNIFGQIAPDVVAFYQQLQATADLPERRAAPDQTQSSPLLVNWPGPISNLMSHDYLRESVQRPLFALLLALLDPPTMTHLASTTHAMISEQLQRNHQLAAESEHWQSLVREREQQINHWQRLAEEREARLHQISHLLTRWRLKPMIRLAERLGILPKDTQ